jgi:acyl-CoA-binding protein
VIGATVLTVPQLYGLYKVLTVAQQPTTSRPGLLDFTGRAKWDSWKDIGLRYNNDYATAEQRYINLARELGWIEGTPLTHAEGSDESDNGDPSAEELLARDTDSEEGVVDEMGAVISTMMTSEDESPLDLHSLHGLALHGDEQLLQRFLDAHDTMNIDERDENVSLLLSW